MVYLTNKPLESFNSILCTVSAVSFKNAQGLKIPQQVVVEVAPGSNVSTINQLLNLFKCKCIEAPVEFSSGNIIYVVQDGQQNIVKLELP